MSSARVFGGGGFMMNWPDIRYTGEYIRRITEYGGLYFFEYILMCSGALTVGEPYVMDLYLVGGGGRGASAAEDAYVWYRARPGGGSGYQSYALAQLVDEGVHPQVIGGTGQSTIVEIRPGVRFEAAPGGNATAGKIAPLVGAGFTGTYYLYGDEAYPSGSGGGATAPVDSLLSEPGRGGGGCTALPGIKPGATCAWRRSAGTGKVSLDPIEADYSGFGAGAMGGLPLRALDGSTSATAFSPSASPGVAMLRMKL